jgi:hypothetical protein
LVGCLGWDLGGDRGRSLVDGPDFQGCSVHCVSVSLHLCMKELWIENALFFAGICTVCLLLSFFEENEQVLFENLHE